MKPKTILLIASLLIANLHAQEKIVSDPFSVGDPKAESEPEERGPVNISICYEAFSLPLAMAADLQRQKLSDPALYAKLISELGKESVRQEVLQIVRTRSGQRCTSQSISEHIYPVEYKQPATIDNNKDAAKPNSEPATVGGGVYATAWETRDVGNTLEMEPHLSEDSPIMDLRILPQLVTLAGYSNWETPGSPGVKMPNFEKQSVDTTVIVMVDKPFLLGTSSRPPSSKVDSDSANRIWFAFVTATLAKP